MQVDSATRRSYEHALAAALKAVAEADANRAQASAAYRKTLANALEIKSKIAAIDGRTQDTENMTALAATLRAQARTTKSNQ